MCTPIIGNLSEYKPRAPWLEVSNNYVVDARAFVSPIGLRVLISIDIIDGKRWIHVSVSRKSRCPDYQDLCIVKREFIGDELPAYQVFPKSTEHRNLHPNTLHLWSPLDEDPFGDPFLERADRVG